jgi:hypothetical protein
MNEEHERLLDDVLDSFRLRGFRVFKMKKHPDGLVMTDNELYAVEVTTGKTSNGYKKRYKYSNEDYDGIITIANTMMKDKGLDKLVTPEIYQVAIEMRLKGVKYREIAKSINDKYGTAVSPSTICTWVKYDTKPTLVRNMERI